MDENDCIRYAGEWISFEYIQQSVMRRLSLYTKKNANGCIIWQGGIGLGGYGKISIRSINGRSISARPHRLVAIMFYGDIGDLEVDHECRNRLCCNIAHLEPVTGRENTQRMHRRIMEDKCANQIKMPWRGEPL